LLACAEKKVFKIEVAEVLRAVYHVTRTVEKDILKTVQYEDLIDEIV